MAAYAALASVMHIIDTIEHHHSPPISIDKQQVESLTRIVTSLQEFLEGYKSPVADGDEADPLEMRIVDAAHAVEDVIESHIVNVIELELLECCDSFSDYTDVADLLEMPFAENSREEIFLQGYVVDAAHAAEEVNSREEVNCINFYQDLQQVIEEMNVIKKEAMETSDEAQLQRKVSSTRAGSLTSSSTVKESMMVGFDDVVLQLLDKLTGWNRNRQIIPITGMGGIGKTTLARHIFEHALIKEHFDIRAWTTISQTYNVRETLSQVLHQVSGDLGSDLSENELGEKLYKYLCGRRYIIILDDMWSIEVWDKMRFLFPDYNDGSRVIVTTRLSNLATELTNSTSIGMRFLDDVCSWSLFSKTVFGDEVFPLELEEIGKKIVGKCKGLPLSIVVIGGLLAKSELTLEYWEGIEKNLSSIVNSENDEYCLRVLKLSYDHLPIYLKPCFLYMGVFEEDKAFRVSELMRLWVSEGFVKRSNGSKSLEEKAEYYLVDLVERNLVLVTNRKFYGKIKSCRVHDIVREFCVRQAAKEKIILSIIDYLPTPILRKHFVPRVIKDHHSISARSYDLHLKDYVHSSHVRTIICIPEKWYRSEGVVEKFSSLRVLHVLRRNNHWDWQPGHVFDLVHLTYLASNIPNSIVPSAISKLYKLQALIIYRSEVRLPMEIWRLQQLRHLIAFSFQPLPNPEGENNPLENLQELSLATDLVCSKRMVEMIPNIKKLGICYSNVKFDSDALYCLNNLKYLCQLEKLKLAMHGDFSCIELESEMRARGAFRGLNFPLQLRRLTLSGWSPLQCGKFHWEEVLEKISSLPLLEKLRLSGGQFATHSWEIVEGQFPSLKYLSLLGCEDMECWTLEGSCLPRLEQLHLSYMWSLEEFPTEIGEIPTLKSIRLFNCSESMAMSLKKIVEEQEELQGDSPFHVLVKSREVSPWLQSLATPNFRVVELKF